MGRLVRGRVRGRFPAERKILRIFIRAHLACVQSRYKAYTAGESSLRVPRAGFLYFEAATPCPLSRPAWNQINASSGESLTSLLVTVIHLLVEIRGSGTQRRHTIHKRSSFGPNLNTCALSSTFSWVLSLSLSLSLYGPPGSPPTGLRGCPHRNCAAVPIYGVAPPSPLSVPSWGGGDRATRKRSRIPFQTNLTRNGANPSPEVGSLNDYRSACDREEAGCRQLAVRSAFNDVTPLDFYEFLI
jgi:hypothetical protein